MALAALAIAAALGLAKPAFGAEDPVSKGTLKLKLSSTFEKLLRSERVRMVPKAFSIEEGSIDPIAGTGTLTLQGRLRFQHEGKKVVFRKLTARLGSNGVLKTGGVRMFRLRGRAVERNGFGAEIKDVNAKLTGKGARKLNSRLGLHSLHRMRAGEVAVSEEPQTVGVTGGTVHLVPDPNLDDASGTLASKLDDHCINFITGNNRIEPGTKAGPVDGPFYDFPVTGGTVGPDGTDGTIDQAGGIQLNNARTGLPSYCNTPNVALATLRQSDFAYNLLGNEISSDLVISETVAGTVPTAGDQGFGSGFSLDASLATVSASPLDHTVTIKGIVVRTNKGGALFLNQTFPQPTGHYNGAREFESGDLFGTVDLTVTTR